MKTISTHTLKYTLRDIHKNTDNRKFCFVIGAGASRKSGISTGGELAEKWFNEIKERIEDVVLKEWIKNQKIDEKDLAASYGSIYRKRFENDKTSGYEFLVQAMKASRPSFGHIVLAQILSRTSGHCVLTTNFDSLVESSVYQFTNKTPLVCGHESLSGYARPSNTHPLIIKIHRDLLLEPKSDPDDINKLAQGWKEPLDHIFSTHIPVIVGYGGNDGSLMTYFETMNKPTNLFWCGLNANNISDRIKQLIEKCDGSFVTIKGFDELMFELLWVFDEIKPIKDELNEITNERIQIATKQLDEITTPKVHEDTKLIKTPIHRKEEKELSALEYGNIADKEPDFEKRKQIYLKAIDKYPSTGWLWNKFTYFLHFIKKDYAELDMYYQKALAADPSNANNNGNYAIFLYEIKKDYTKAEEYYIKALAVNPDEAFCTHSYADFLCDIKKDYTKAEKYYLKALGVNPDEAYYTRSYANFLSDIKKDYTKAEKYYLKALASEPNDANNNFFYASFLQDIKKDYTKAEKYYLNALASEPNDASNNFIYASFLQDIKKDYTKAEKYYLKALASVPNDASNNFIYASFLQDIKKDYTKAEKYYLNAIAADPNDAYYNGNYASFLQDIKKDYTKAEKYYLKALTSEPNDAYYNGIYASFLQDIKKDYIKAEKYYLKALAADPNDADYNGIYASFLQEIKKDYDKAEQYYLKALAVNPNDAGNNCNYAVFFHYIKNDYTKAEDFYLKALSADPDNAIINCNYTQLLLEKGRKLESQKFIDIAFKNTEENNVLLGLWFLRYSHFPELLSEAENKIEELLSKGIRSTDWNFTGNIEQAIKEGHPYPEKLKEFARRITTE